ncbi:hypothetical protein AB0M39_40120, partial [Streptomyces sp. NPDC051907]|uniref:hypothetical protein n=1 Tax=Streptomyces sp. NPDC051907 TaxID=3155284 RepID=UPI00342FCD6E
RRAAVRAAQHAAGNHRKQPPAGRVPTGPVLPWGLGQATVAHHARYGFACSLARHPHGTYVLAQPSLIFGDEWRHWWEYAYRNRREAVAAFQWSRRYVPAREVGRAFHKDDTPITDDDESAQTGDEA